MTKPINPLIHNLSHQRLMWLEEEGVGFFDCEGWAGSYDQAYFDRYKALADSDMGRDLMSTRADLVQLWLAKAGDLTWPVMDVGIGSGAFLEEWASRELGAPVGFDINPAGIEWLEAHGAYRNFYGSTGWKAVCFWDALEHIPRPDLALLQCVGLAFVALPIFNDAAHVLRSRHYRRDEHFWYWTRAGFVRFAEAHGFAVLDILATETALGREGIETFILKRK